MHQRHVPHRTLATIMRALGPLPPKLIRAMAQQDAKLRDASITKASRRMHATSAWLNIARAGDFHDWHRHTGARISSVLFLNTLSSSQRGALEFRSASGRKVQIKPKAGLLVFFPATLEHRTQALTSGERRSLAIDFDWASS